jgi:hypothetical protein
MATLSERLRTLKLARWGLRYFASPEQYEIIELRCCAVPPTRPDDKALFGL